MLLWTKKFNRLAEQWKGHQWRSHALAPVTGGTIQLSRSSSCFLSLHFSFDQCSSWKILRNGTLVKKLQEPSLPSEDNRLYCNAEFARNDAFDEPERRSCPFRSLPLIAVLCSESPLSMCPIHFLCLFPVVRIRVLSSSVSCITLSHPIHLHVILDLCSGQHSQTGAYRTPYVVQIIMEETDFVQFWWADRVFLQIKPLSLPLIENRHSTDIDQSDIPSEWMTNKSISHHRINGNALHPGLRFVLSAVSLCQGCVLYIICIKHV